MGSDSATDDNEVVKKVLSGDRDAYRAIVDSYGSRVVAFCRSRMRSDDDARDAAQDVFLRAYSSLSSFRAGESFAAWLFAIAGEPCADALPRIPVGSAENRGRRFGACGGSPRRSSPRRGAKTPGGGAPARGFRPASRPALAGGVLLFRGTVRGGNRARPGPWGRSRKDQALPRQENPAAFIGRKATETGVAR